MNAHSPIDDDATCERADPDDADARQRRLLLCAQRCARATIGHGRQIAYTTTGSAVPAAQPILQFVPDHDTQVIEARIRPQEVDQLRNGQDARIVFSGLDRQATPDIPGKLIFVSPELTRDDATSQAFYRIRVRVDAATLARNPQIALKAGMPTEVFVSTGSRSLLSYITKPLLDQVRYALRDG